MPSSGFHYPHDTIESAGHSLSGHADTLHSAASSASGISLPQGSLGSLASGHASTMQSHIGGVPGHINTIADREGQHGDTLVQNATNMRNIDEDHANRLALIHSGPSRNNLGSSDRRPVGDQSSIDQLGAGGGTRALTPAQQAALDANRSRVNAAGAGLGPRPYLGNPRPTPAESAAHEADMDNYLNSVPSNHSYPAAPHQPAPGTTEVPLESHQHMGGELKPTKKPQVVGGHVGASDYHSYTNDPASPWKTPLPGVTSHNVHGQGVMTSTGTHGGTTSANGVYDLKKPNIDDGTGNPLSHNGKTPAKPMSTMFPQGVPAGQVWGMGEQAWNGGNPAGGHTVTTGAHGPGGTWEGHAQVPYTPTWNPGGADHGSGDGNNQHAGETVNVAGYSRPMVPGDPTMHPATYFPKPPADQPVPNPDNSWVDNTPKRTYDDPNYPE